MTMSKSFSPIEVELVADGAFWKVKQVKPRRNGVADPEETGDIEP